MNPLYIFSTVGIEIKYLNKLLSFPTEWGDNRIGVSDRSIIPDDRFTASSTRHYYRYKPHNARLNGKEWGWAPKTDDDSSDYLQIDLGAVFVIRAVATQGHSVGFAWTTEYKISTSTDSTHWTMYQSGGKVKVRTCAVIILYWEVVAWSFFLLNIYACKITFYFQIAKVSFLLSLIVADNHISNISYLITKMGHEYNN